MTVKKLFVSMLAGLSLLTIICGCGGEVKYRRRTYYDVMNSTAELVAYADCEENGFDARFEALAEEVRELIEDLDKKLSATEKTSDVSRFNDAAAGEKVEISAETYEVLGISENVYRMTEGYYNPAVYYSLYAYGFNGSDENYPRSREELPEDKEITEYVSLSSHFGELKLEESEGKFYAVKPEFTIEVGERVLSMKIDLGGVAKGYAADRVSAVMDSRGFGFGYFSFGSSSIAVKKFPADGNNLTMKLSNPRRRVENGSFSDPQEYISFPIMDDCLSTSGDNVNYFMLDTDGDGVDERLCHVFDPFSGRPVQSGVASASVAGGSAAENDALTTAIMAMGAEKAQKFIKEKLSGRRVVFTLDRGDGLKLYTNMGAEGFTLTDTRYTVCEI